MKNRKIKDIGYYLAFYHTSALSRAKYINMYFTGFKVMDIWDIYFYYDRSIQDWKFNYNRGRYVTKFYSGRFFCGYLNDGYMYTNCMHRLALGVIYVWYDFTKGCK